MKTIYSIAAYLLVALGTGHTLLTPVFYHEFSADTLWFAGTGLLLLFLGLINITNSQLPHRVLRNLSIATNLIGTVYIILVTIAVPEFQAFMAMLAALTTSIGSISNSNLSSHAQRLEEA